MSLQMFAPSRSDAVNIRTVTGAASAQIGDFILASSGAFPVTLPTAVGNSGRSIRVMKTDSSFSNLITIATTGGQTIGGSASRILATQNEEMTVTSDGANWQIIERVIPSAWTAYTPTSSWISNTTLAGFWRRVGDSIEVQCSATTSGAPTAANLSFTLPSGLTFDSTRTVTSLTYGVDSLPSTGIANDNGSTSYKIVAAVQNTTTVRCLFQNNASGAMAFVTNAAPFAFGNTDFLTVWFSGPITNWQG